MTDISRYVTYDTSSAFPSLTLTHPSTQSSATIYLYGATLKSWTILNHELLFLSPKHQLTKGKGIRGGIPIVFPQFGSGKLQQHGFARTSEWKHVDTRIQNSDLVAIFELTDNEETREIWNHSFVLKMTLVLKQTSLSQQLSVTNTGKDDFEFTWLLHTYFNVSDINKVRISGLQNIHYVDKVDDAKEKKQSDEFVTFNSEVDRVYKDSGDRTVTLRVGNENGTLMIKTSNFNDYVVWNPAFEKANLMGDLGGENYTKFVCIEAGTVSKNLVCKPNETISASQGISLQIEKH